MPLFTQGQDKECGCELGIAKLLLFRKGQKKNVIASGGADLSIVISSLLERSNPRQKVTVSV